MALSLSERSVAIIGVGLMGGSLGLAAQAHARIRRVKGFSRTAASLELALKRGAITEACHSLDEAVAGADLVFVATPVMDVIDHTRRAHRAASPGTVISDVGSTKAALMDALTEEEQATCIGGHPLCGSETAGVANATASLYQGATYFLTPGDHVHPRALELLYAFLTEIGARPVAIDPEEHDRVMALVSHLPHIIANELMSQAGESEGTRDALLAAGPSFRDMTRVAGSNRRVWTDIFLQNREALSDALRTYMVGLEGVLDALEAGDAGSLAAFIGRAAANRERMLAVGSLTPEELYRIVVKIPDRPGVLRDIMVALGDAGINIEDLTLHHMSAELGGLLDVYVLGEATCAQAAAITAALGYPVTTTRAVA